MITGKVSPAPRKTCFRPSGNCASLSVGISSVDGFGFSFSRGSSSKRGCQNFVHLPLTVVLDGSSKLLPLRVVMALTSLMFRPSELEVCAMCCPVRLDWAWEGICLVLEQPRHQSAS
ncbi:hypothetical protein TIFTF001_027949 [Ficus carica]|uniref:Uncharacterized protein n=1 Tax=Ficus carica TaxID=3494 RepID=A0AA88DNZ8_FICCA|nr:hypothetical protein TIFTF001_027949 [Ficus carica]